jgi:hypothetical protein
MQDRDQHRPELNQNAIHASKLSVPLMVQLESAPRAVTIVTPQRLKMSLLRTLQLKIRVSAIHTHVQSSFVHVHILSIAAERDASCSETDVL